MTNIKEYLDYISNREYDEWFPFECIINRVRILVEFSAVINNHPEELSPTLQGIIKRWGVNPAYVLNDYRLLEIRSFYWIAFKKFGDTIKYPKSTEIVIDFRNKIIGHLTIENPKELIEWYEKLNTYGIEKIYSDYDEFKEHIRKKIESYD